MSFANFDLEAQKSLNKKNSTSILNSQTAPQNGLDKIISDTTEQLHIFGGLISRFDTQRKQIGTRRDSIDLRNEIDKIVVKVGDMDNAIKVLVLNLSDLINKKQTKTTNEVSESNNLEITNRQLLLKDRLTNEYKGLHSQFDKACKVYNEKKRTVPLKTYNPVVDESSPLLLQTSQGSQTQIQQELNEDTINETEIQYHTILTEEREREIERVSEAIQDVNTIFKDLGELVNQQGEQLDTIEDNIMQLHGNTKQADRELKKAHEYQKRKGKWTCIILVALCIFVLIVVLTIIS